MKYKVVTLNADGIKERQVLYMHYEFNQQIDVEGQPVGRARGGQITLRVKTPKDGNTDIVEWMCNTYMSKNGYISVPTLEGGELKRIDFTGGYVVAYSETYDFRNHELEMYEEFTISAKVIKIGVATHNNSWTLDD